MIQIIGIREENKLSPNSIVIEYFALDIHET